MDNSSLTKTPTRDLFRLRDRTILVTGGLGGIGSEVVTAILESGGDVICFDLPREANVEKFHDIARANQTQYYYCPVNVTDAEEVSKSLGTVVSFIRFPLRGAVTCAGISGEIDAVDYPAEAFRKLLDINIMGTFLPVQAAARVMQKQNSSGSVVLVASISGYVANKGVNTAAYNSSKSAVLQLGRSLAADWGTHEGKASTIRVNSLSPGYIETPLSAGARAKPEILKQWIGDNMLHRISKPEEYRAPVLFLLGDGSSFMTGADLRVDGGHCAW